MQVEIYADVVFFINFIMDFFIFWIVSKMIRKKTHIIRLILGAFIASILYCLTIFITIFNSIYNIFSVIAILLISIIVCFKPKGIKELIKLVFFTFISSFSIGGCSIALFYLTDIQNLIGNMIGFSVKNFSFKVLIASSCTAFIIIKIFLKWYEKVFIKKQSFCNLKIYCDKTTIELNALIDTGNSLHEPISNKPVIVAEFLAVKEFLPDKMKIMYYEKNENDLKKITECLSGEYFSNRMRMIPFSSLGKQNGMLIGFKADKVEITGTKEIILKDAVIAIYNFKLSKDGFYNALLNPEILDGAV